MGATLLQGQASSVANPVLVFFAADRSGFLVDPSALSYQVFDVSDDAKRLAPVQVFPASAGTKQSVNLATDKLGTGRFVANYTAPSTAVGMYEVRWFWKILSTDAEQTARKDFEILAGAGGLSLGPAYAFVSDVRAEGVYAGGSSGISDVRLQTTLVLASRFIETMTGRYFEPRYLTFSLDGGGGRMLLLDDPIIALEYAAIDSGSTIPPPPGLDASDLRVFNRHIRQGLSSPDDRNYPKIEFVHDDDLYGIEPYISATGIPFRGVFWPRGVQNCHVIGVFGFTERDGSPWGATPALIRHVTKLLVLREMVLMTNVDCRDDYRERWRTTSVRTRDQQITLANPRSWGGSFGTGDPEIDAILALHMRPPALGAV